MVTVTDFRGEEWTFVRVTRQPEPGRSGKVEVRNESSTMVFNWSVFPGVDFSAW